MRRLLEDALSAVEVITFKNKKDTGSNKSGILIRSCVFGKDGDRVNLGEPYII